MINELGRKLIYRCPVVSFNPLDLQLHTQTQRRWTYVGRAFMTVVVGGPGVVFGTAGASGLLGGVNSLVSNLTTSVLGTAALLVVAIVILRFLPTGISGYWEKRR